MTDIVDRLITHEAPEMFIETQELLLDAAEEIERLRDEARLMRATAVPRDEYELLRGEIERLRAALEAKE